MIITACEIGSIAKGRCRAGSRYRMGDKMLAKTVLRSTGADSRLVATDFGMVDGPGTVLDCPLCSHTLHRSTYARHEWLGTAVYR